jgi:[FeFe] hydrogenase H-cluster maturation GTPase HydF
MSLNSTPSANRVHIGFFGCRNAGKSSVVNAVTGQQMSIVSDTKGTTTDPVYKTMELLPLGPVMIIDTPGFDDEGMLGELRIKKTKQVLNKTDIAVLVVDAAEGLKECDQQLISLFQAKNINYLIVYNKSDLLEKVPAAGEQEIYASALKKENIHEVKERIAALKESGVENYIIADKLNPGDFVVLVVPIDSAAPKGRLILPQQQTIRDILDAGAIAIVTKESELTETLESLGKKVNNIKAKSSTIIKAAEDIDNYCEEIINKYISKIQTKLETFEVKINKEYRKFEKSSSGM